MNNEPDDLDQAAVINNVQTTQTISINTYLLIHLQLHYLSELQMNNTLPDDLDQAAVINVRPAQT